MSGWKISTPVNKVDNKEKTGGFVKYTGDVKFEGMLYAKTLRSSKARARIRSITIPALPEGYYTVDKTDIPGKNRVKQIFDDQPFFADGVVNYIGEPVLLVVGSDKGKIREILSQITIEYQELEPVLRMEDAQKCVDGPIFDSDNCFAAYSYYKGLPGEAFAEAAEIIEEEYRTGHQEQAYLEPQAMIGVYEDEKISIYGSLQCPYYVKGAVVQGLGWSEDRVRIVQMTLGGGFGGKEDYPSLLAGHAAFAALKTGKPVAILLERGEDMISTPKRHPSLVKFKTALGRDKKILAMEVEVLLDGGAYAGISNVVLQRTSFNITGVYRVPNLKVSGRVVATNTVPNGAFRGFGAPQAFFAIEMHMQSLARRIGMDPLEYKKLHMVKKGDLTATSGTFAHDVKLPEMIAAADEMSGYSQKVKKYSEGNSGSYKGIGMSLFLHGCGFTGSGERDHIKAVVKLRKLGKNGRVEILVANVDMGQGLKTTLRKIVAGVLDISLDSIDYENPDTDRVPDSGPTVASRTIMIVGKLLEEAASELKQRWQEPGDVEVEKRYKHPERIQWDDKNFRGDAYPTYSWGVNVVEVAVDPVTLQIDVTGVWTVFDVGTAIDERIMRGQIDGGVMQGLGYGTLEVMNSKGGRVLQGSMTDYIIPTSADFCKIESKLIENPYEGGPFGAKGAGELTLIGAAPALAAAVSSAMDIQIHRLPVTPEYLLEVVSHAKSH